MLRRKSEDCYLVIGQESGRTYHIVKQSRAAYRGVWDVCNSGGGRYGTFATLPGVRHWASLH